jgi:flagellar biosynthesis protein FlhA
MTGNLTTIVEHVRARLARQISHAATGLAGYIPVLGLSPAWEQRLHEALVGDGADRHLALPPSELQELVRAIGDAVEAQAARGELAVILTSPALRPHLRAVIERFRPAQTVLSHAEIHPRARLRTLGQI